MPKTKVVKAYIRPDNKSVITCPHCQFQKEINVEPFTGSKSRVKIKCSCKEIFVVQVEHRKKYRKKTNLSGTYINHSQHNSSGRLFITNVSISGLEFTTLDLQNFKVDDEVTVTFNLDDEQRTEVIKDVLVKDVRQKSVGCEFERGGDFAFDGPLGFYVMN
jgi:hypothetical protein